MSNSTALDMTMPGNKGPALAMKSIPATAIQPLKILLLSPGEYDNATGISGYSSSVNRRFQLAD